MQTHSHYLEKQLDRLLSLNPEMRDFLDKKAADNAAKLSEGQLHDQSQVAHLISSSTLMKSYEAIMQQYEQELDKKTKQIAEMQSEQQQLVEENSNLTHQLYTLKTKFNAGDGPGGIAANDEDKIERIQKDQMVALLKRNHDTLLEKYEIFRQRNEVLEKLAVEKENMYNEVKIELDKLN